LTHRRNALTRENRQQLLDWLEAERPKLAAKKATTHKAAILAHKALGFPVTRNNISWFIENHDLGWLSLQIAARPKHSWRCPLCGVLMKKPKCPGCNLSASRRLNEQAARRHGQEWLRTLKFFGIKDRPWKTGGKRP